MTSKDGETSVSASMPELDLRTNRSPTRDEAPLSPAFVHPLQSSSPSMVNRSSTLTSSLSRSSSPSGRLALSFGRLGRSSTTSPLASLSEANDDIRSLIIRGFSPTIALCASPEVDQVARKKGLKHGFRQILRPFGERVPGKVVIRDSTGASRAWEDFGVRFTDLEYLVHTAAEPQRAGTLDALDDLLDQYIESSDDIDTSETAGGTSPYYQLFLARLLASMPISQHEAFQHPAAAVIAISSSTPSPIETLRNMYQQTAQGSRTLPIWANPEYLRYYVLVHDEDKDDISRSTALFDQMKRHFGLHCHLLRLRSAECTASDDDVEELPQCQWLTASEEVNQLHETAQLIDLDAPSSPFIFASDATSIRAFVRELVAQSIVPHMEQKIALWNEQIASRRRGLSGRFMNFSKRWAGIGSSSKSAQSSASSAGSGGAGNYDSLNDQYRYDTPEALLRRMADFALMLRDYKLAASTFELLRSDFSNDKAWKYQAGANEMCCIANLLNPLANSNTKALKIEAFDQMLETASYSYLTRCSQPAWTLRSILLAVELLKVRGAIASELAAKWAVRILQLDLVGGAGHVLVTERVTSCLVSRTAFGPAGFGARKRKAAMWNIMAADEWMKLGKADIAAVRLDEVQDLYGDLKHGQAIHNYDHLSEFMGQLQLAVKMKLSQARQRALSGATQASEQDAEIEEVTEQLEKLDTRPHRRSVMGAGNLTSDAPLSPVRFNRPDPLSRDDDFE